MKPLKFFSTLFFLAIACSGFAQERYIEVIVDDTLHRKVKEISYMIHSSVEVNSWDMGVTEDGEDGDEPATEESMESAKKKRLKEQQQRELAIQEVLKKGGFSYSRESDIVRDYEFGSKSYPWQEMDEQDDNGYVVKVKSFTDLERLVAEASKIDGARGEVMWMTFDTNEDLSPEMLRRLSARAKSEATKLAELSGVKLGALISASDYESNVGTDIMDLVLRLDVTKGGEKDIWRQVMGIFSRKMRFRFAIA